MKLAAMVDIGRVDPSDIKPKKDSVLDMIRIATYVKDIDKAIDLVKLFNDRGYETTVNIMAISNERDQDLDEALTQLSKTAVGTAYVVDSFGSLYSEQIEFLVKKYKSFLPGKTIGIHAHNNTQLAFGNTIESIIHGANMLDATVYGIGRGAGNCPLELLIGFLKNPKFKLRPLLDLIETEFVPLRNKIEWGYLIPYALTDNVGAIGVSNGGNLPADQNGTAGAGTQTAGLLSGGGAGSVITKEYNGSSWAAGGSLPSAKNNGAGDGTQTAAYTTAGYDGIQITATYEYNGSSWTTVNDCNVARHYPASAGNMNSGLICGGGYAIETIFSTESYDGTTWSMRADLNAAPSSTAGCGSNNTSCIRGGATASEQYSE